MNERPQWNNSREIVERIFVRGELELLTPTHFGNGDAEGLTDMPLHRDPWKGAPLLTGASIAGALRNYLREYEMGYRWRESQSEARKSFAEQLFGHLSDFPPDDSDREAGTTVASWLMVDDAIGEPPKPGPQTELRDGVTIDPRTRTAMRDEHGKGFKYDMELLAAGTTFPLRFELALQKDKEALLEAFVVALQGLERGEIGMGLRKRRGLGECRAGKWQVWRYKTRSPQGLIGWLTHREASSEARAEISEWLGSPQLLDKRRALVIDAEFELDTSLLIRAETGSNAPVDMTHLRSKRGGVSLPVLTGTSTTGVLRGRALRIANTLLGRERGEGLVDEVFGKRVRRPSPSESPTGSRVTIRETLVENGILDRVQNRVKIDRFTGGSFPQALFSQQALWGGKLNPTIVRVEMRLQESKDVDFRAHAGLLLLTLKDLWTGDLPLGGESSVGRGRLRGRKATLCYGNQKWELEQSDTDALRIDGDPRTLEEFAQAVRQWQPKKGASK